ncbi:MAG: MBG domain-containing protein, partial [Verrucomicrobia bacterium]|nr:MBG domain-containing protein [Verrucomicrobiota bacterium]
MFTASYSGWLNGESVSVLGGAPSITTTAITASVVGAYPITAAIGTLSATNYGFSFTNGVLTVNRAEMTITANPTNRVYGAGNPVLTGTVSGIMNSDNISGAYSTAATAASPVGTYNIVPSLSDPDGKLGNYSVTTNSATLTISKAVLTVSAEDKSRKFGESNPTFTAGYSGWVAGDTATVLWGEPSLTTAATTASGVGTYPIVAATGTLSATNYSLAFTNGVLTINKANGVVTLESLSQTYTGSALPITSWTTPSNLTVVVAYDGQASAPTNAGNYPVTGTLNEANYSGSSTNTLVIAKATPIVSIWPVASTIRSGQALSASVLSGGQASVPGGYSFKTPATVPPPGTYSAAVVFTPTDTSNYNTVDGLVSTKVSYVALTGGAWNDPATWGGKVPEPGDDIVIGPGINITIQGELPVLNNLTIQGNLSLGTNTLRLTGNFTNSGTFNPGTGTVELTGPNPQYLAAVAPSTLNFNKLTINKTSSTDLVTATSKLKVSSRLGITKGKLLSASDYGDVVIESEGTLELTSGISISGNFTNSGTLTTAGNTITFDGRVEQYLALNVMTWFDGITVAANTILTETVADDNAIVDGVVLNQGVIRKTQAVPARGHYYFGLAGEYNGEDIDLLVPPVPGLDPATTVRVDRVDANHPNWPNTNVSALYWKITLTGTNMLGGLTLPHAGLPEPQVCRYEAGRWDWMRIGFSATTVGIGILTNSSDWVVYNDPKPIATVTTVETSTATPTYGDNVTFTA